MLRRTWCAVFLIMARNGPYLARTGHDHDSRPKCLNLKLGHNGYNARCPTATAGLVCRPGTVTGYPLSSGATALSASAEHSASHFILGTLSGGRRAGLPARAAENVVPPS